MMSISTNNTCDWVDAYGDYLFNYALGQVRDPGVAEDLVQETFLAALKSKDNFARQSTERTWLVGILRHKICDHLRRLSRERCVRAELPSSHQEEEDWEEAIVWVHETASELQSPSRRMELAEFRQCLEIALGKLPPRIAEVFRLYEMEEQSQSEVCERMRITDSNLWVMLHRARKQLREHLAEWWNAEGPSNRPEASRI